MLQQVLLIIQTLNHFLSTSANDLDLGPGTFENNKVKQLLSNKIVQQCPVLLHARTRTRAREKIILS